MLWEDGEKSASLLCRRQSSHSAPMGIATGLWPTIHVSRFSFSVLYGLPSTTCSNFANPSSMCSCLQSRLQKSPSSPSLCLHVHNIWANWYWTNPWQNQSTLIARCVSHVGFHQLYTEQFNIDQRSDELLWHYVQHIVMLSSYTLLTVDLHRGTWLLGVHVTQYAYIFSLDESTILQSIHLCHMRSRIDSNYVLNLCQYSPACPCAVPSLAARRGCWVCLLHCSYVHLVFH